MINLCEMLKNTTSKKLGCLMALIDKNTSKKLINFGKKIIKDEDLYHEINEDGIDEYGREESCHITLKYGFTKDLNELDVRQLLEGQKQFMVEIYELDMFTNNQNFDVVKFKVKSPELNQLNELSGIYPAQNDYSEYSPHLTLGYVKKGTFQNLKNQIKLTIPIKSVEYSPISGDKSYFNLNENDVHYDIDSKISRLEQEWEKLDNMGTQSVRQNNISKELEQLRKEKGKKLVDPNKAKDLFAQIRQSVNNPYLKERVVLVPRQVK